MKRSREPDEEPSRLAQSDDTASQPSGARAAKITELDVSAVEASPSIAMRCTLPPHREGLVFESYGDYEAHYSKAHTNRCVECRKNFPSEHFLIVHIEECHDAIAAVLREKGEHTYSCFVEGCERKCGSPQKRRMHLIDKHMFPRNYFFAVTKEGIDGRNSLLLEGGHRRRGPVPPRPTASNTHPRKQDVPRCSTTQKAPAVEEVPKLDTSAIDAAEGAVPATEKPDVEMEDLAGAMSALQFIPSSVRFGRGKGRAGFSRT